MAAYCTCSQFFVFLSLLSAASAEKNFEVKFDSESTDFKVYVGAKEWLRSGIFRIRHGGEWWSSESQDKYALVLSGSIEEDGTDSIGAFFKRR